jgi:hypothetical protein
MPPTVTQQPGWLDAYRALFPKHCWDGSDVHAGCDGPKAWMRMAVTAGKDAGIDPRLVLSVMQAEVVKSQDLGPIDDAAQWAQVAPYKVGGMGLYGTLKKILGPLVGKGGDQSESPPTIGWGNMSEALFNKTKRNHPEALGNSDWTDMIGDDPLAVKAMAFALSDYVKVAKEQAPEVVRKAFTPQQAAATLYNVGDPAEAALRQGRFFGPKGTTYGITVGRYNQLSDQLICHSGVYTCS